jgi:hypothetical protein
VKATADATAKQLSTWLTAIPTTAVDGAVAS